jgi:glycosyltransferase involved in cell wall biosynthesis
MLVAAVRVRSQAAEQRMKISVVTAVRNSASTIEECIRSVAAQSYAHEHIVVDGLSDDGTVDLLQRNRQSIDMLISERDSGIYNALNKGIRSATGDVIGFLHADDVFADQDVLEGLAAVFSDPSVDVAYGDLVYVDRADLSKTFRYWRAGNFSRRELGWGWMPPHPTLYVRRSVYAQVGGFDETFRIAADYDHILRIFSSNDVRAAYIPRVLVKMRVGGVSNSSLRNILRKSMEDYRALRRNRIGGVATLIRKNFRKIGQFSFA